MENFELCVKLEDFGHIYESMGATPGLSQGPTLPWFACAYAVLFKRILTEN